MANIYQVIEDLSIDAMRDLLADKAGSGFAQLSEQRMRNTVRDLYELDILSGRDIREMAEGGV